MLRTTLLALLSLSLSHALVVEVPLLSSNRGQLDNPVVPTHQGDKEWRLDALPDPDATDHLVFDTVYSLLQHWPNTRMRNGHNIVPGIIPEGTNLYHGTDAPHLPQGLEWYGLNVEHSHFFCRKSPLAPELDAEQGCWLFALETTRPLKIIYFDGNSAAKLPWGPLDTQDVLAWGEARPQDMWLDSERANDLCKWAKQHDVDGFVRMEMAFEIIACNFTAGITIVSATNVARPYIGVKALDGSLPIQSPTGPKLDRTGRSMFETLTSGTWQNHFPGETRIQLDLAGLVSFYDTELVPSLVPARAGQERWDHRVRDVSPEDSLAAVARLEAALTRPADEVSGTDWKTLIQVIVDRFAGRLALTRYLVNSSAPNAECIRDLAHKTQTQLRIMLTPYLLVSATPTDGVDMDWSIPIWERCATTHAHGLRAVTDAEKLLLRAVRGTAREICRVVTRMWAMGVHAGVDPSLRTKTPNADGLTHVLHIWEKDLSQLMAWLDWSVWVRCEPECGPEEICYLPTWPIEFPFFPKPNTGDDRPWWDAQMPDSDAWIHPQPTCISRVADLPW